jgi:hypothetical protein
MRILITILALLLAPLGHADLLMAGTKGIRHTFEVRGLDRAPEGMRFFAFPTSFTGLTELEDGRAFSFYKLCTPHIYATEGDLPVIPENAGMFDLESIAPGLPVSAMGLSRVSSLPEWSATDRIHTVCEFQGIEDGLVLLVLASETHYDAKGKVVSETHYDTGREAGDDTDLREPVVRSGGFDRTWLALPFAGAMALGAGLLRRRRKQVSA